MYKDAARHVSCFREIGMQKVDGVKKVDLLCNVTRADYWMSGSSLYATYAYKKKIEDDCHKIRPITSCREDCYLHLNSLFAEPTIDTCEVVPLKWADECLYRTNGQIIWKKFTNISEES